MRYALESVVLALGSMERSVHSEQESYQQEAFRYLKDLRSHLDAINDIPRKVIVFFCSTYSPFPIFLCSLFISWVLVAFLYGQTGR